MSRKKIIISIIVKNYTPKYLSVPDPFYLDGSGTLSIESWVTLGCNVFIDYCTLALTVKYLRGTVSTFSGDYIRKD